MPIFILFFIVSYYISSKDLATVSVQYPHFLLVVLLTIWALIVVKEISAFIKENKNESENVPEVYGSFAQLIIPGCKKWYKQIGYVLLAIVYVLGIYFVGYYVSTVLFAAAMAVLLGVRKPLTIILVSVGITVATWAMMSFWLKLSMPVGLLF